MAQPTPGPVAVLASQGSLLLLAAAMIAARLYLRLKIQRRRLMSSDVLMCVAWVAAVAAASFDIQFAVMGALDPKVEATLKGYDGGPEEIKLIHQLFWASNIPYYTTFYLCKASLLVLYLQLFPRHMHKRRIFLWSTITFVAHSYLASIFMLFLICLPIESNWSLDLDTACSASRVTLLFQVTWALHFTGDLLIFALPWLIVPGLQMKKTVLAGVYCAFLLGIINIVFCLLRFITIQISVDGQGPSLSLVDLWSNLDCNISLVIACLPSLRPYLHGKQGPDCPHISNSCTKSSTHRPPEGALDVINEPYGTLEPDNRHHPSRLSSHSNGIYDDLWDDGKKSNASDVELVPIKA